MNQQGSSILMLIFELLVVIIVIFGVVQTTLAFNESDTITKVNIAEDIRMMVDTLVSVPGDAVVEYPRDVSRFIFILGQDDITIYKSGESEFKTITRIFYLPEGYYAVGFIENADRVCLEKTGHDIFLRRCELEETTLGRVPLELGLPSQGIYTYDAGMLVTDLYYTYREGRWLWSPDQQNWMPTTTTVVQGGDYNNEEPVQKNIEIITYLERYNPKPE